MEAVVEAVDVPCNPLYDGEITGLVAWRGEDIPFIRLRQRLGFAATGSRGGAAREHVVVVRYSDRGRAALVVDELFGECQTVVKPLAKLLQGITGVSGSAILPDGKIAFIVDVPDLLQSETSRARRRRGEVPLSATSSSADRAMAALTMN
jgi:two-component system chemotaxis sensor kinase CheA